MFPIQRVSESWKTAMSYKVHQRLASVALAVALLALSLPAMCELGGDMSSVGADQARMKASVQSTQKAAYAVHELRAESGTTVREFVSPAGKVFAVAWSGPQAPNLRDLLGSYFEKYSEALQAAKAHHPGHGPISIRQSGLVVESGGHMRFMSGRAFLPHMLPAGVSEQEIR